MKVIATLQFIFIFALCAFCAESPMVKSVGYGETKDEAIRDAIYTVMMNTNGVAIRSEIIVLNGVLERSLVMATSKGFIRHYEVVEPFDGFCIVIWVIMDDLPPIEAIQQLTVGMSQDDVWAILGEPRERIYLNQYMIKEQWNYSARYYVTFDKYGELYYWTGK